MSFSNLAWSLESKSVYLHSLGIKSDSSPPGLDQAHALPLCRFGATYSSKVPCSSPCLPVFSSLYVYTQSLFCMYFDLSTWLDIFHFQSLLKHHFFWDILLVELGFLVMPVTVCDHLYPHHLIYWTKKSWSVLIHSFQCSSLQWNTRLGGSRY